jgi:hypothetical protein
MSPENGILKPKWGLYKGVELVSLHDSREVLEGYLRDLVNLYGVNPADYEIKTYSGS